MLVLSDRVETPPVKDVFLSKEKTRDTAFRMVATNVQRKGREKGKSKVMRAVVDEKNGWICN